MFSHFRSVLFIFCLVSGVRESEDFFLTSLRALVWSTCIKVTDGGYSDIWRRLKRQRCGE